MPAFPDELPPLGLNVNVVLNGTTLVGFYEDGQWWVGLPDNEANVPINNEYVTAWSLIE